MGSVMLMLVCLLSLSQHLHWLVSKRNVMLVCVRVCVFSHLYRLVGKHFSVDQNRIPDLSGHPGKHGNREPAVAFGHEPGVGVLEAAPVVVLCSCAVSHYEVISPCTKDHPTMSQQLLVSACN